MCGGRDGADEGDRATERVGGAGEHRDVDDDARLRRLGVDAPVRVRRPRPPVPIPLSIGRVRNMERPEG